VVLELLRAKIASSLVRVASCHQCVAAQGSFHIFFIDQAKLYIESARAHRILQHRLVVALHIGLAENTGTFEQIHKPNISDSFGSFRSGQFGLDSFSAGFYMMAMGIGLTAVAANWFAFCNDVRIFGCDCVLAQ
jgi:hypothetical protein